MARPKTNPNSSKVDMELGPLYRQARNEKGQLTSKKEMRPTDVGGKNPMTTSNTGKSLEIYVRDETTGKMVRVKARDFYNATNGISYNQSRASLG